MFAKLVGTPYISITYVPHPVSRVPAQQCKKYIEGNDPVTSRPIIDEIIDALTNPLTEEAKLSRLVERPVPRLLGPDTEENLRRYFLENEMTDYLPIILPTEERVAEMLKGTSHKPDEIVGEIRSSYDPWSFTVEKVAANAVMAGARPEYMPVILAMTASGTAGISTSTQSFIVTIAVNGPIRNEIGMNSGIGAMSPFNQANAVIGRVATLLSISQGGGRPGKTYWGSQGNPFDYNHATFAENEEELPDGWKPFHVQKGFEPEESAVSFFRGYSLWHWKNTFEFDKNKAILQMSNWVLPSIAMEKYKSLCGFSLLLDPIVADDLVREGFPTKESLAQHIYENAQLPLEEFWQYHLVENARRSAEAGMEPLATLLKQPQDTLVKRFGSPEGVSVFVVGGRTNDFWQGGDWSHTGSFSIDDWR